MKKIYYIILSLGLLTLFFYPLTIKSQTPVDRTYFFYSSSEGNDIKATLDGNYVMTGEINITDVSYHDVFIAKIDENGDTLWLKVFEKPLHQSGDNIIETSTKDIFVVGRTWDPAGLTESFVMKTDSEGRFLWDTVFSDISCRVILASAAEDQYGNYIVVGNKCGTKLNDIYLISLDVSGRLLWERTIDLGESESVREMIKTSDENFIILGSHYVNHLNDEISFILKLNQDGDTLWSKTLDGFIGYYGRSIIETQKGDYLVTFHSDSLKILSFNQNGILNWDKIIPTKYFDPCIVESKIGNYHILSNRDYKSEYAQSIITLDSLGELLNENILYTFDLGYNRKYRDGRSFILSDDNLIYTGRILSEGAHLMFVKYPILFIEGLNDDTIVCGESYYFNSSIIYFGQQENINFSWQDPPLADSITLRPKLNIYDSGQYRILANADGYIAYDTAIITVQPLSLSNLSDTALICGDTIQFHGIINSSSTNISYNWTPIDYVNDPSINNPKVFPTDNTFFQLVAADSICTVSETIEVDILPADFNLDFTVDKQLLTSPPFAFQFSINTTNRDLYDFIWYFGDGDSLASNNLDIFHEYDYNGLYDVTVLATHKTTGCQDTVVQLEYIYCTGGSDPGTGIVLNEPDEDVNIVYNELTENIRISTDRFLKDCEITILDPSGRILFNTNYHIFNYIEFNFSGKSEGVYFITIRSKDFVTTRKIIKL